MEYANAKPEKRFFVDLVTRDISLVDAILDLIDNAVDSLVRTREIDLYRDFLKGGDELPARPPAKIEISYSNKHFQIVDNCGGISFERAKEEVFRFGHPDPHAGASLSVFGIGMKRALFKIGRQISIESRSSASGFQMELDVNEWMDKKDPDWQIAITNVAGETDIEKAGTRISINRLREEIAELARNPKYLNRIIETIQETYPFFLGKHVDISVNDKEIKGEDISFGTSPSIRPAEESWEDGNVKSTLLCGLLPRQDTKWTYDKSGWYLVCNGRVIVYADKTQLTGWGAGLPQFMPKNRGFLGVVFFRSEHPEELPWNTTKRGINSDSAVFIRTLKRMVTAARPVIQFQNKSYDSADADELREEYRQSVRDLEGASATQRAAEEGTSDQSSAPQSFQYPTPTPHREWTSIQFEVKIADMDRVKKRLGSTSMSNRKVGSIIFKYYLDRECAL